MGDKRKLLPECKIEETSGSGEIIATWLTSETPDRFVF
jgi:hypothetical protein